MPRSWFEVKNAAAEDAATVSIFDEIGMWGITAADFNRDFKAIKAQVINLEINSPGGSVFDGIAIYNILRASGKTINAKVMGVAASIASIILMSADKITMPANAMLMVHAPSGGVFGTADDMREMADVLDKVKSSLVGTYMKRTGKSEPDVNAMLAKDTWMTAAEAKDAGFADEVIDAVDLSAKFDMERIPEAARAAFTAVKTPEATLPVDADKNTNEAPFAEQVTALAKEAGFEAHAASWSVSLTKVDEVKARIAAAREIKALCEVSNLAKDAEAYIRGNKTVAEVRTDLQNKLAAADKHIDTTRSQQVDTTVADKLNPSEVYAKRGDASKGKTESAKGVSNVTSIYAKRNKQSTGV